MKERIIEFLKAENKTSAQLAEEIGVQPSGISHIISGRNKPSLDFVLKMIEKYKFISTDWLLFGKGSMYKEPVMKDLFDVSERYSAEQPGEETPEQQPDLTEEFRSGASEDNSLKDQDMKVEKIVWFYNDNSFKEYKPSKE
ncbi:MAG: helix-turn-helix transcriptional regulator [Bacteroidales bacterium]|nr:helix-turn-helix transcriptional regulator [Bacteroidales bacterium]